MIQFQGVSKIFKDPEGDLSMQNRGTYHMKKLILGLMLLATGLMSGYTLAQSNPAPNVFFIQVARHGSLTPIKNKPGYYQLKLKGVDDYVQYLSDKPTRAAGLYPVSKFIQQWDKDGFNKLPPNVEMSAIELHLIKNKMVNTVMQLSDPVYNAQKRRLTYIAHILPGENNKAPMKHLDHVALFVNSVCASCAGQAF